jgi:NADPH:quinone reductase-like Zn-dependent oxidoreductase
MISTRPKTIPKTMKAAVIDAAGPAEALHLSEVDVPQVARDQVLIAVDYAGVGIWDAQQRAGSYGAVEPGTIPGADGAGTIAAVGSDVRGFQAGDRVYSYAYGNPKGFYAEYVCVPADSVALVPSQLDQSVAGAMPCVALTALSGLEALDAREGQTLAIFGASGGVGSLAVWLASGRGMMVTGTARAGDHAYVRELGAAHAIDPPSSERTSEMTRVAPKGFDAALVTANGDALPSLLAHLRPNAPFAYPNGVTPEPKAEGHPGRAFNGEGSRETFGRLNTAIGSRTIPLRLEIFSLNDVVEAHRRVEQGHVVGKIVLRIA